MKKTKLYRYLGRNGIVTTPIEIIGVEPIRMYTLQADEGKILTNGEIYLFNAQIFAEDLEQWKEIGQDEIKQDN